MFKCSMKGMTVFGGTNVYEDPSVGGGIYLGWGRVVNEEET